MTGFAKSRIDRVGDALRSGDYCAKDLVELDQYRRTFESAYQHVVGMARLTFRLPVTGRPSKSTNSIVDKLRRESMRLAQMQDISGCRIIVEDIPSQDLYVNALKVFLGEPRIVDRRVSPSNGYRAVHLMPVIGDRCVEIQVRTMPQHLWAEMSEKLADTVDARLKYGEGDENWRHLLMNLSSAIQNLETEESDRAAAIQKFANAKGSARKIFKKGTRDLERSYQRRRSELLEGLVDINRLVRSDYAVLS